MKSRDIIDILCEWDIKHLDLGPYSAVDGLTLFENKEIYLCGPQRNKSMRDTVIHELLHVHYDMMGIPRSEKQIILETKELYKKYYKIK